MNLLLHPVSRKQLDAIVESPGGSLLLHGAAGVGKRTAANEVSRLINCDGCKAGECRSCRMVSAGNHPDISVIRPDDKNKIGIDAIHGIEHQLHYRQYEAGSRRTVIIQGAETKTVWAQNALLKMLEEPPAGTTVILTASNPVALLETIVSRCRQVYLAPVGTDDIAAYLASRHGINPTEAAVIAEVSHGAPGRAVSYAQDGESLSRRQEIEDDVRAVMTSPGLFERMLAASRIASQGDLGVYLDVLASWARQAARQGSGPALANLQAVEAVKRRLAANVSPKVAFEALAVEAVC